MEGKKIEVNLSGGKKVMMREPLVRDLKAAAAAGKETQLDMELFIVSNITGITEDEFEEYPLRDYEKLMNAYKSNFL